MSGRTGGLKIVPPVLEGWKRDDIDVIWIPEYGSRVSANSALQSLRSQTTCRLQFVEYEYDMKGVEIWSTLVNRGEELLDELVHGSRYLGPHSRRFICVCHGLGGIIAKKALTVLSDRYYSPACQHTLSLHTGTVFLGTPHPTFGHKRHWLKLSQILQTCSNKYAKHLLAQAEIEATTVANISLRFEQAGIEEKVISVFETKPTKISEGLFKSRKVVLVDSEFVETRSKDEKLVASDSDHYTIAQLKNSTESLRELVSLINSPLIDFKIQLQNIPVLRVEDDGMWASTVVDVEEISNRTSMRSIFGVTRDSIETQPTEAMRSLTEFATAVPRAASGLPCYLLWSFAENPDFFGRSEILMTIESVLNPPGHHFMSTTTNALRSVTLCGFGGIGKTQIALQYAFSCVKNKTYDAIFWVHAEKKDKLAYSFQKIAVQLNLIKAVDATDPVVVTNIVMEWLSKPVKTCGREVDNDESSNDQALTNWLMIFDNANSPELLRDHWPVSGNGSVLVTSRDPQAVAYLHSTKNINLQPFDSIEASRMIQKLTLIDDSASEDQEASITLSNRLGGYPLALALISTIMLQKRLTVQEALELYDTEALRIDLYNAHISNPYDKYTNTLASVWISEDFNPAAVFLLDIMSLLDADMIFEEILQGQESSDRPQELQEMQDGYMEARKDLIKSSLVKRDTREKLLVIHRVVQDNIRKRMSTSRRDAVFTCTIKMLLQAWSTDTEEKFTHLKALWNVAHRVSSHVNRLMEIYKLQRTAWTLSIEVQLDFARLLQKAGWYKFETGYCESSEDFFELAFHLCEPNAMNNDSKTLLADLLFCSSAICADQNQPKRALEYATKHFSVRMEVERQKKHMGRHAGLAYTEMAQGLLINNRLEECVKYSREGRDILVGLELFKAGKYWPDFATIHEALALNELDRGDEAIPLLEEAIAFRKRRYGPDDTESFKLGFHLQVLANVHSKKGNWDIAGPLYQRSLTNYRATVGDHYYRTSQVCVKLAQYYVRDSKFEAADLYFAQAIKSFKLHSFTKPELIRTLYLKSKFLESIGNYNDAISILKEATILYKAVVFNDDSPENKELNDEVVDRIVPIWSK